MNRDGQSTSAMPFLRRRKAALLSSVRRPAFFYPFKGMFYFFAHPYLYPLLRSRLIPCLLLSLFIFVSLFVWTYLPQALLLLPFHGRAAFFNAAILVLGEGATATALLFEAFFVDETLAAVFDAVLLARGHEPLVARVRELHPAVAPSAASYQAAPSGAKHAPPPPAYSVHPPASSSSAAAAPAQPAAPVLNPVQRLGPPLFAPVYSPFSCKQITEFILLLPLNLVPYVGVPAFLLLTGARAGPLHHHRWFRLRGLRRKERRAECRRRRLPYTWFGTAALLLQLVPGLSMLFLLTTAAGSALWVADLEDLRAEQGGTQGSGRPAEEDPLLGRGDDPV